MGSLTNPSTRQQQQRPDPSTAPSEYNPNIVYNTVDPDSNNRSGSVDGERKSTDAENKEGTSEETLGRSKKDDERNKELRN